MKAKIGAGHVRATQGSNYWPSQPKQPAALVAFTTKVTNMAARNSGVEQEPPVSTGGTQLITVNEEERNVMQEVASQDSEGFVAP